ncbi:hypothetical protein MalM25_00030 [Planctomycetes bacterium MalM25]|nr:hypothetical protein MalM25_00030 [Planctomycetes bacterium MalM25]
MTDAHTTEKLADLVARSEKERKRFHARRPKGIASVLASVMAKRGYAASRAADEMNAAWREVAEDVLGDPALSGQTAVGRLSRGRLEVTVANHVVMQEINFHRPRLLEAMQQSRPEARITAIRFKVGRVR